MTETGLPGVLFGLLDTETDCVLVRNVHHTLTSTLQALATSHLNLWLTLCREVLTSASGKCFFYFNLGMIILVFILFVCMHVQGNIFL